MKPESLYQKRNNSDINVGDTVSAKIKTIYHAREKLLVHLGGDNYGIMKFEEFSLIPSKSPSENKLPSEIFSVYQNNRTIRVYVSDKISKNLFLVSRKKNMENNIPNLPKVGDQVLGEILGISSFGLFVDIGEGFLALCHITDYIASKIRNLQNFVGVGETLDFMIKEISDDHRIYLIHKSIYYNKYIGENEIVEAQICAPIKAPNGKLGYRISINPGTPGIIDTNLKIPEGNWVIVKTQKRKQKGFQCILIDANYN